MKHKIVIEIDEDKLNELPEELINAVMDTIGDSINSIAHSATESYINYKYRNNNMKIFYNQDEYEKKVDSAISVIEYDEK